MHSEVKVSFWVSAGLPEICAFINTVQRLESGFKSHVKLQLVCVCVWVGWGKSRHGGREREIDKKTE